jgi:hypothetical protein
LNTAPAPPTTPAALMDMQRLFNSTESPLGIPDDRHLSDSRQDDDCGT